MPTIAEALKEAAKRLADHDTGRLDAEVLLGHVLGRGRTHLYTWPEQRLSEEQADRFEACIRRRAAGQPIAHLTGHREFWDLDLQVTPDTLIPRPETELLLEAALARIPADAEWRLADLGTGSGAIALALASERPKCRVVAVDRSVPALAVARSNAERAGLVNVQWLTGSWFEPLGEDRFRLIVSNPPYVREGDPCLLEGDVRFEPRTALTSGSDGLDAIRRLVTGAPPHLEAGGWLLLEHGFDQGSAVRQLLDNAGFANVFTERDLSGQERISGGQMEKPS
ncbi:peptide chain release factor N(5)-glutamine methyltransferase [Thiohalomonas denitrificans]|uniref:Release factor glutamine methyltransferase n=1 Tax=Thiohalomonas denitrificans TaxID=415747 RepID=A0A1G5Q7S6_9GAMM|nr:peptide chain release factor N(5)-glutamine methyltransferase [Thiohalomonas denitrificans]SCZ57893.1 [protein release factor]-glutamine N5-methyltransferase [Thiohalomonas denitrificans]